MGFRKLPDKRIGSGANFGLGAFVLWMCKVQKVDVAVEEHGKQQTVLQDVRVKAQSPSTCAMWLRCCWQSTWVESTAARQRSSARWRCDPVECRCLRSSNWSWIEQWCGRVALVGLECRARGGEQVSGWQWT